MLAPPQAPRKIQTLGAHDTPRLATLLREMTTLGEEEIGGGIEGLRTSSLLSGWSWRAEDAVKILNEYRVIGLGGRVPLSSTMLAAFLAYQELPQALEICALGTHPLFRRKGLGSALINHLKAQAALRGDGCRALWLEVSAQNKGAIAAYVAQGFRVVGERPGYYPDGSLALVMTFHSVEEGG